MAVRGKEVRRRECTEKLLLTKVEYGVCYGYVKHCRTILKDLILFFDAIGIHAPEEVSYTHLERFINSLVGLSASTVRSRISLVRMYFRFLFLNGDIKEPSTSWPALRGYPGTEAFRH